MRNTITVRTDERLRRELEARAEALGKSLSEVVREILRDAVAEKSFGERVGGLEGSLRLDHRPEDPWRRRLRRRNWRR